MLFNLALLAYMVAVGFTLAGLSVSVHRLVVGRSVRFDEQPASVPQAIAQTAVLVVGGPVLISNWVMNAWLVDRRPGAVAAAGLAISGFWSFCSGLMLLDIVVSM